MPPTMDDEVRPRKLAKTAHSPCPKLPADEFVKTTSYYQGPNVKIYVDSQKSGRKDTKVYELPRNLLTQRSSYFQAAFNGNFMGAKKQELHLNCLPAVFDMMVQFMYTGDFVFPASAEASPVLKIDVLLDFIILSDMLLLGSNDTAIAKMKELIKKSASSLQPKHVREAAERLPSGHELREVFALACVWPYIVKQNSRQLTRYNLTPFKFAMEVGELECFASELFKAHMKIYKDGKYSMGEYKDGKYPKGEYILTNPVTGETLVVGIQRREMVE